MWTSSRKARSNDMLEDTVVNRVYVKKSDFQCIDEFKEYIAETMRQLTRVEGNMVLGYLSGDPNVYIIECNPSDPNLSSVFPYWVTAEEMLIISKYRDELEKSLSKAKKPKKEEEPKAPDPDPKKGSNEA